MDEDGAPCVYDSSWYGVAGQVYYSPLHDVAVLGTTAGYADAVTRGVGYDLVGRVQGKLPRHPDT